ncbi:MAG: TerB family tellurite resistance protein [Rubrivivax sp.]|nr:TerB family tellurite resistance protein [Rubrivivax sp.]
MPKRSPASANEAPARALAMMVAANGHIDERELRMLDDLDAFRRLAVSRPRLVELARLCVKEVGAGLSERSWLCLDDMMHLVEVLDAVVAPEQRLLVCRLAAAVIIADGHVTHDERRVYGYALAHWGINQEMVTQAIRQDSVH